MNDVVSGGSGRTIPQVEDVLTGGGGQKSDVQERKQLGKLVFGCPFFERFMGTRQIVDMCMGPILGRVDKEHSKNKTPYPSGSFFNEVKDFRARAREVGYSEAEIEEAIPRYAKEKGW